MEPTHAHHVYKHVHIYTDGLFVIIVCFCYFIHMWNQKPHRYREQSRRGLEVEWNGWKGSTLWWWMVTRLMVVIILQGTRYWIIMLYIWNLGLPSWCSGIESACQCRRYKRSGFSLWVGKIPWRRKWQPAPVFLPGKFHGQRSLANYSLGHHKVGQL